MPFHLRISKEEVKSELTRMGYTDLNDELIEEFRKDLLKLIKEDLRNLKKLKKSLKYQEDKSGRSNYRKTLLDEPSTSSSYSYSETEKEKDVSLPSSSSSEVVPSSVDEVSQEAVSSESDIYEDSEEKYLSVQKTKKICSAADKGKDGKDKGLPAYPERPDAVNLYHYYKAHWDKFKVPGEEPRSTLRWDIRSQLFYSS